jgi:hypothetical protein
MHANVILPANNFTVMLAKFMLDLRPLKKTCTVHAQTITI